MLLAPTANNWAMLGQDFFHLAQQCDPILPVSEYHTSVRGSLWIEATYTFDGKSIFAVASQDLSDVEEAKGCRKGTSRTRCWVNALASARSSDMGDSFHVKASDDQGIASMGLSYHSDWNGREGFFAISNILRRGSFYYAFISMEDNQNKQSGNCLIRTMDLASPFAWRGWDGFHFNVSLRAKKIIPGQSCTIVGDGNLVSDVRSINYIPSKSIFVAVFLGNLPNAVGKRTSGAYYSTSQDLLNWSIPRLVVSLPIRPRVDSDEEIVNYPVILDPSSKSQNFETIDTNSPVLVYVDEKLLHGVGTMDRNIDFIPLKLN